MVSALQGMFIKRHKIEKDDGGGAFRPADFAIGAAVRVYSRVMTVVDADPFTRRHMAALGLELGDPLPYPADPTEEYRSAFGRKVAGSFKFASHLPHRVMHACEHHVQRTVYLCTLAQPAGRSSRALPLLFSCRPTTRAPQQGISGAARDALRHARWREPPAEVPRELPQGARQLACDHQPVSLCVCRKALL